MKSLKSLQNKALALILGITLITPHSVSAMGGEIVFDPTTYASILESIEKYNTMIKNMQDTLDTMNRINDVMNTASNQLNNLQTGLADPRQLYDRFQSNLQNIQDNANRIAKNLEKKDWSNAVFQREYAACRTKWQNLLKAYREKEKAEVDLNHDDESSKVTFENNEVAQEINTGFAWIEKANNEGLQAANDEIHKFFNNVQNKVNILDLESKMMKKDKFHYTANICKLVNIETAKLNRDKAVQEYIEAMKNNDLKSARKAMTEIKKQDLEIHNGNNAEIQKINEIIKNGIFELKQKEDKKPILQVNVDNGSLNEKIWKNKTGKNKNEIVEERTITIGNGDNQSTRKVWIVKQDVINQLFDNEEYAEALNLQNDRNMALAMGSDTYALTQAQAETLTMISKQIMILNDSVNAIGQIANEFLKKEAKRQNARKEFIENTQDDSALYKFTNESSILQDYEPSWEYDEYGTIRQKVKTDAGSILN